ncbi:MAG: hypothetical protein IKC59_04495 [Clostridia bacterium]|nr:hypothetical protein [Clostridia bacterium]
MTAEQTEALAQLEARLSDHLSKSDRGSIAVSRFLTPQERKQAERYLAQRGVRHRCVFWGGYGDAERTCLLIYPPFYEDFPDWIPAQGADPSEPLEENDQERVTAVRINGSGFRVLTHRDYLGSLLGLGLERNALGDIAVQSDCEAVVFCKARLVTFLIDALQKVASDTVRCSAYTVDGNFTDGRHYKPISDTVASARLDCVVAALTNLSRDDAQNAVRSGLVDVDFETEERVDRTLTAPATVSVRGFGRYILRAFDGETKKGRLRLRADQLV